MERVRNWPAWIALALAGLALFVALGGRRDQQGWRHDNVFVFGSAQSEPGPDVHYLQVELRPDAPVDPERSWFMHPGDGLGRHGGELRFHSRGPGFLGILGPLFLLSQLAGLALLGWLVFRLISDRHNPPASGSAPTPDPRVE